MKKGFFAGLLFAVLLFLSSCSYHGGEKASALPHIGEWVDVEAGREVARVVFKDDGTGSLRFHENLYPFEYILDYSKKPVTVDLIYTRQGKPFRAKVIIKFVDHNRMKWRTFFNEKRPEDFPAKGDEHTIILTRSSEQMKRENSKS